HGARLLVNYDVPSRQHPLDDLEKPVLAHAGAPRASPPRKRWHVLGWPCRVEHVRARTDHRPRGEQRSDRRLGVVADQAAKKLEPGLQSRAGHLEAHRAVGVLQVRGDRARTEVHPPADHRVAHEPVVRLVRVSQEHAARQFPACVAVRADGRPAHRPAPPARDPPRSTTPPTPTPAASAPAPSHVAPAPTPHPTGTPQLVSRNAPSGSAGASPCGAKVVEPITAGPVTGRLAATRGMSPSTKPARWGRAKIAVVSLPTNVSQRSRIRCAPARSSDSGRAPANGAQARVGSGSNRYSAWPEDWRRAGEEGVIAAAPAP